MCATVPQQECSRCFEINENIDRREGVVSNTAGLREARPFDDCRGVTGVVC